MTITHHDALFGGSAYGLLPTYDRGSLAGPSKDASRTRRRRRSWLVVTLSGILALGCAADQSSNLPPTDHVTASSDGGSESIAAPTSSGSATSPSSAAMATDAAQLCDSPALELAAETLGIEASALYPGERYPNTGSCVFWSRTTPGTFVVVQLRDMDSSPPAWPCGPQRATTQRRADIQGSAAVVRACTPS